MLLMLHDNIMVLNYDTFLVQQYPIFQILLIVDWLILPNELNMLLQA